MTVHIVYLRDHNEHRSGEDAYVDRSLGRSLMQSGIALSYTEALKRKKKMMMPGPRKRGKPRKKAISRKAQSREMAIMENN